MKKMRILLLTILLNLTFIQTLNAIDISDWSYEKPFHHVENCGVCHDISKMTNDLYSAPAPGENYRGIRNIIQTPNSGFKEVIFRDRSHTDGDMADFADGDTLFNGICEVCHTINNHHRNDGSDNTDHFNGKRCTSCHLHDNEFAPPVEQAHRTHLDYRGKGPLIQDCVVCHTPPIETDTNYQFSNDVNFSVTFRDGNTLATTTSCDNCHSPWGAFPGGPESEALMLDSTGAKANFRKGIYEKDGFTLKDGKEKWCITCHDDRPSTTHYDSPPESVAAPQTIDYRTTAFTFNPVGYWTERELAAPVDHKRANAWNNAEGRSDWITMDFNISVSGSYMLMTQWDVDYSNCSTADGKKPLLISITDANGTTTQSYEQSGYSPDFSEMATFSIEAGAVQLKVQKDAINCTFNIGPIKIEPRAGSGDKVVIAPMIAGDNKTWGFYATGHGVSGVQCTECHDPQKKHIDYDDRTHEMGSGRYNVINSWGDSYRLRSKDPIVGGAICARCHDFELIWERADKITQTNFKNETNGNNNAHAYHMAVYDSLTNGGDSDWDGIVDSDPRCTNCHNIHGSTKPHMFRDGNLVSSPYTSNKKPMFEHGWEVHVKATWKPVLQGGSYEVFARWPSVAGAATNAPFTIKNAEMFSTTVNLNQTVNSDTWVSLGTYNFNDKNQSYVILNDKYTDGTVIADAVRFTSIDEDIIIDNGDNSENGIHTYSTLGVDPALSGATGYNSDYDAIAAGTTNFVDVNASVKDYNKPLLVEQNSLYIVGNDQAGILENKICKNCHDSDIDINVDHFTGPKILNRFEAKRWVLNDGSEDAEVYVTARDYDSNISSVTLDLTPIGGTSVAMTSLGQQLYHYTIPAGMISGLSDISYKLPITAIDTDGQSVTDETYLFPKDSNSTIYLDTDAVALYNVHFFRFAVNTAGASWGRLPGDVTYFGPGYRYNITDFDTSYGIWQPKIPKTGKYEVYGFWNENGNSVKYTTYAADGTYEVIKDQTLNPGQWNYIGTYNFLDDDSGYVKQMSNDGLAMVADAMKFVRVNSEPLLRLSAQQHEKPIRIIDNTSGSVIVTAIARDYDDGDTPKSFTYDWTNTDVAILEKMTSEYANGTNVDSWYNSRITFFPTDMAPGIYTIEVTVTDTGGLSVTNRLQLQIPEVYPVLGAVDTDGDGINDDVEGYYDFDEDGVPNYLDNNTLNNEIASGTSVITTEEGLELNIGTTAFAVGSDDGVVTATELTNSGESGVNAVFDGVSSVGGLFDFDILGLDSIGQSVKVAFLLQDGATIPTGAVYKKYDGSTWQDFVIDPDNAVHSATSTANICPTPGADVYTVGLTAGDDCIQLTIQDGGPNDADGLANAEIKDPGAIFADFIVVNSGSSSSGGWGSFNLLSLLLFGVFGLGSLLYRRS